MYFSNQQLRASLINSFSETLTDVKITKESDKVLFDNARSYEMIFQDTHFDDK